MQGFFISAFPICLLTAFAAAAQICKPAAKMGGLLAAQQIYHSRYGFVIAIAIKNCSHFSAMCARKAPDVLTLCGIEVRRKGWYIIAKERVIPMDKVIKPLGFILTEAARPELSYNTETQPLV